MAKPKEQKIDDYGFDADLDFDMPDFGSSDGGNRKALSKREVATNMSKEFGKGAIEQATSPAFIRKLVTKSLPAGYGAASDMADQTIGTIQSLYNDTAREMKPLIKDMKKTTKRILPVADKVLPKGVAERIKRWTESDPDGRGSDMSAEQQKEASLTMQLGEIFKMQTEASQQKNSEDDTNDKIKAGIEHSRHKDSIGQMDAIRVSLENLVNYQNKVTVNYQKKSLELQFRHYFVSMDSLEEQKRQNVLNTQNLDAIKINTALPEFVKLKKSEALKEAMRNKFIDATLNRHSDFIRNVGNSLVKKAKEKISSFKDNVSGAMGAIDAGSDAASMVSEMGGDPKDLLANMGGGMAADAIAVRVAKMIRKMIPKGGKVDNFGSNLGRKVKHAPELMSDWANTDEYNQEPIKNAFLRFLDSMGEATGLKGALKDAIKDANRPGDTGLTTDSAGSMQSPDIFGRQTNKSITEIIPGYLARIYRELQILRTGDTKHELTTYDFTSNKFSKESDVAKNIFKGLFSENDKKTTKDDASELINKVKGSEDLNDNQKRILGDHFIRSRAKNFSGSAKRMSDASSYTGEAQKYADIYAQMFKDHFKGDNGDKDKEKDFMGDHNRIGYYIGDSRKQIQDVTNLGQRNLLEKMGLISKDSNNIDLEKIRKYHNGEEFNLGLDDHGNSSPKAKQFIKPGQYADWQKPEEKQEQQYVNPQQSFVSSQQDTSNVNKDLIGAIKDNSTLSITRIISETLLRIEKKINEGIGHYDAGGTGPGATGPNAGKWWNKSFAAAGAGAWNLGLKGAGAIKSGTNNLFGKAKTAFHGGVDLGKKLFKWGIDKATVAKDIFIKGIDGPVMTELKMKAGHYKEVLDGKVIKTITCLEDLTGCTGDIVDQESGNIIIKKYELVQKLKEAYVNIQETGKSKLLSAYNIIAGTAKKALNAGSNMISGVYKFAWDNIKKGFNLLTAVDIYVKDEPLPALLAMTMKAGGYTSAVSGKSITNPHLIDGPVKNHEGNYALTNEQIAKGLEVLENGVRKPLVTGFKKLYDMAKIAVTFGMDKLKKASKFISDKAKALWGKAKGVVGKGIHVSGMSIGGSSGVVHRLTEIRDMLNDRLPGERSIFATKPTAENTDPSGKGFLSKAGDKAGGLISKLKGKFNGFGSKIGTATNWLGGKFTDGLDLAGKGLGKVRKGLLGAKDYLTPKIKTGLGLAGEGLGKGINLAGKGITATGRGIKTAGGWLGDKASDAYGAVKTHAPGVWDSIKGGARTLAGGAYKTGSGLLGLTGNVVGGLGRGIGGILSGIGSGISSVTPGILKGIKGIGGGLMDAAGSVGGSIINGAKSLKDKLMSESKTVKRLTEIRDLLKDRLPKPKEHILGDSDGDGIRDGSYEDQMAKQKKKNGTEDTKNASGKDTKAAPGLMGKGKGLLGTLGAGIGSLFGKKKKSAEGEESEGGNGLLSDAADAVTVAKAGGKGIAKAGSMAGKLAKGAWGLGKGALSIMGLIEGAGAIGLTGAGAAGGMGLGASLLAGAGTVAGVIGSILTAPVVLGVLAAGLIGYGIYKFATRKKLDVYSTVRYVQYGFSPNDQDHFKAIFELEDKLLSGVYYDGGIAKLDGKKVDTVKLIDIFDVKKEDKSAVDNWMDWLLKRFKPVYLTHLTALNSVAPKTDLESIKDLKSEQRKQYLNIAKYPDGPYNVYASPFPELDSLPAGSAEVTTAVAAAQADIDKDLEKDGKKVEGKSGVVGGAAVGAAAVAADITQTQRESDGKAAAKAFMDNKLTPEQAKEFATTGLVAGISGDKVGSSGLGGKAVTIAGAALALTGEDNSTLSPIDIVRFKTYGLNELETDKIQAIKRLEKEILKNISYIKGNTAKWEGSVEDIMSSVGSSFGLTPGSDGSNNWLRWFNSRFMPTYLNYLTAICTITNKQDPDQATSALKPNQAVEVATAIISTNGVWQSTASPWTNYSLNTDTKSTDRAMDGLRDKAKSVVINEATGKPGGGLDSKQKTPGEAAAAAGAAAAKPQEEQGFFSKVGSGILSTGKSILAASDKVDKYLYDKTGIDLRRETIAAKAADIGNAVANSTVGQAVGGVIKRVIKAVTGNAKENKAALIDGMQKAGITDPSEQAMFLAQMDHESGGFKALEENLNYKAASFLKTFGKRAGISSIAEAQAIVDKGPDAIAEAAYGGRWGAENLGNNQPGDGLKYRGRSFVQLTGRSNYTRAGAALGIDLVNNPDLAADPATAAKISTWYWKKHKGLSDAGKSGDVETATKIINGGLNGLAERKERFAQYLQEAKSGTLVPNAPGNAGPGSSGATAVATATPIPTTTPTSGTGTTLASTGADGGRGSANSTPVTASSSDTAIPVSDQSPGMSQPKTVTATTTSNPDIIKVSNKAPVADPAVAVAGAGFASPRSRDLTAQAQYQKDDSPAIMGVMNTTLQQSLSVQQSQLSVLESIFKLIGNNKGAMKVNYVEDTGTTSAPKMSVLNAPPSEMPRAPVSMARFA